MLCLYLQNSHPYLKDKLWSKRSSYFSVKDCATSNSVTGRLNPWLKRKAEREEAEKRGGWKRDEAIEGEFIHNLYCKVNPSSLQGGNTKPRRERKR